MQTILLVIELVILFILSRMLYKHLYTLFLLLFRQRSIAVSIVTAIMFPGTVTHELAHLFTAEILGVHTGKLTLVPESIREVEIQTGSVEIAKTGPFRRSLIGLAPLFIGIAIIATLSYFLKGQFDIMGGITTIPQQIDSRAVSSATDSAGFKDKTGIPIVTILLVYLLFTISNSMFPSKPDLKGVPAVAITLGVLLVGAYLAGIRLGLTGQAGEIVQSAMLSLNGSIGIVLAINGVILLATKLILLLFRSLTRSAAV